MAETRPPFGTQFDDPEDKPKPPPPREPTKLDRKPRKGRIIAAVSKVAKIGIHFKDWEYAEYQYRLGAKKIADIADEIGVTKEQLTDYISHNKITRDLGEKTQHMAMDMLAAQALPQNGILPVTEQDIISINATLQASLIAGHRADIARARRIVMQIMSELEYQTDNQVVLDDLGTIMNRPDEDGNQDKLKDIYDKVISMPGRVDAMKKLGDALKVLIMLERQAFGIRDDYEDPKVREARTNKPMVTDSGFDKLQDRFRQILNRNSIKAAEDAVVIDAKTE